MYVNVVVCGGDKTQHMNFILIMEKETLCETCAL